MSEITEDTPQPSIGRIVLYLTNNGPRPAIITDLAGAFATLVVFDTDGVPATVERGVPYDPTGENFFAWRWPPRV
jgi:hypothetical protein